MKFPKKIIVIVSKQIASCTLPVTREVYDCRIQLYSMKWSFKNTIVCPVASLPRFPCQDNQSLLLPRIMRFPDKCSARIIRIIAKQLDINRREMLFFNFKFTFSYLVRTCVGSELKRTLEFLEVSFRSCLRDLVCNLFFAELRFSS